MSKKAFPKASCKEEGDNLQAALMYLEIGHPVGGEPVLTRIQDAIVAIQDGRPEHALHDLRSSIWLLADALSCVESARTVRKLLNKVQREQKKSLTKDKKTAGVRKRS